MNSAARTSMMCGIGSIVCLLLGCIIPFVGTIGMILAVVALIMGFQGRRFAAENNGDGASDAMIGIATGAFTLISFVSLICLGLTAGIGLVVLNNM
jgi:hypothetical protein